MFTKQQVLMLRDAIKHYIEYQVGVNSSQALEYEDILKMLEDRLTLLDW